MVVDYILEKTSECFFDTVIDRKFGRRGSIKKQIFYSMVFVFIMLFFITIFFALLYIGITAPSVSMFICSIITLASLIMANVNLLDDWKKNKPKQ